MLLFFIETEYKKHNEPYEKTKRKKYNKNNASPHPPAKKSRNKLLEDKPWLNP